MTKTYTKSRPIIISPKRRFAGKRCEPACRYAHRVVGPSVGQTDFDLRTVSHQILHIFKKIDKLLQYFPIYDKLDIGDGGVKVTMTKNRKKIG